MRCKLLSNETWEVPFGCPWFAVFPNGSSTFQIDVGGAGNDVITNTVPYQSPETFPIISPLDGTLIKIIVTGTANLTYIE